MNWQPLIRAASWLQQPTSVAGLSAIAATGAGLALHQVTPLQAVVPLVFGTMMVALPDNSQARGSAVKLATDIVVALGQGAPGAAVNAPKLVADVADVARDLGKVPPAKA